MQVDMKKSSYRFRAEYITEGGRFRCRYVIVTAVSMGVAAAAALAKMHRSPHVRKIYRCTLIGRPIAADQPREIGERM
jgi:hypothetical protein